MGRTLKVWDYRTKNVRVTLKERDFHGKFGTNAENSGQTLKILN